MQGEFEVARAGYRRARRTLEELGWTNQAALTSLDSGPIELLAGDPAAAEAELRRDYETLDRLGERNYISTVAAVLAEAVYEQGRLDEADRFATVSAEVAAPDDVATQFLWRGVRGKLLARQGRVDEGEALVREAVRLARSTDELISPANALMDLAEVLCLDGRRQEAAEATDEAIRLYEQKGSVVAARRARLFRQSLELGRCGALRVVGVTRGDRLTVHRRFRPPGPSTGHLAAPPVHCPSWSDAASRRDRRMSPPSGSVARCAWAIACS